MLDDSETPQFEISNSHLRINLEHSSFTTKLIDGRFPDYEKGDAQRKDFVDVGGQRRSAIGLARTAILSNEKYRVSVSIGGRDSLHLQAHNPEHEAEEEIEVDYDGPEMTIGFNVGYLLDVLGC